MVKAVVFASAFAGVAWGALLGPQCFGNSSNGRVIHKGGQFPTQLFKTVPYNPPELEITSTGGPLAPGLLFLAPDNQAKKNMPEPGPVIMTSAGEMVWHSTLPLRANNFRAQTYKGKPVLTYWDGTATTGKNIGHGYGAVEMFDDTYKQIRHVCPKINIRTPGRGKKYPCYLDLHEGQLTNRNTLLATAYDVRPADLSRVGGSKKGYVFSGVALEIDPDTNKVLFQWSSLDHVPVTQSHINATGGAGTKAEPMDYFHINSIELVDGNYLINSRNTWSTFLVSPKGRIIWQFDGATGGDFGPLPKGGKFRWAHDARVRSVGKNKFSFSIFNNDNTFGMSSGPTTGLLFTLPNKPGAEKVVLERVVAHHPPIRVPVEGAYTPDIGGSGNQLMGYGDEPFIAEFNKAGKQLWSARFGKVSINYRAFKEEWHATPFTQPKLHVNKHLGSLFCKNAHVSWNGATDLTGWMIYAGKTAKTLKKIGPVPRHGFETSFLYDAKCVQASAMRGKKLIRASNIVCK